MAKRTYRLKKRAATRDDTRERIVRATSQLHGEQGVAATSHLDVAQRAGVGAATVYRHFPTLGALVQACSAYVWDEIKPPMPADAAANFDGIGSLEQRLERLLREVDAFYERGEARLKVAERDRDQFPELDEFLKQVEASVRALAREALGQPASEKAVSIVVALTDFPVWQSFRRLGLRRPDLLALKIRLLRAALGK